MRKEASPTRLLTIEEAAARLGMKPHTIRTWVYRGQLPTVKFGDSRRGSVRIDEQEIERLIAAHRRPVFRPFPKPVRRAAAK
jgi:excisionase family DNA binding protein